MSTYYRKLEKGEIIQEGDISIQSPDWFMVPYTDKIGTRANGKYAFRPVEIVEAPPKPPVHRVEDETWFIFSHSIMTGHYAVCTMPHRDYSSQPENDRIRAKRICAGQEALKLLERGMRDGYPTQRQWKEEILEILNQLKL